MPTLSKDSFTIWSARVKIILRTEGAIGAILAAKAMDILSSTIPSHYSSYWVKESSAFKVWSAITRAFDTDQSMPVVNLKKKLSELNFNIPESFDETANQFREVLNHLALINAPMSEQMQVTTFLEKLTAKFFTGIRNQIKTNIVTKVATLDCSIALALISCLRASVGEQ